MVKKRQTRSKSKNRLNYTPLQKENSLRFNAILMSAITIFVIIFIYFIFLQPYFNLKSVKVTGYSITGKAVDDTNFFCEDSDINIFGGQNNEMVYYSYGFVNTSIDGINYIISQDSCTEDNSSVIEYFCNSSYLGQSITYECPTICKNGVCLGNFTCADSDAMNYNIKGHINYSIDSIDLIYNDYCSPETENTLVEFYCSGNNINYSFYSCPINYSCSDGRCNYITGNNNNSSILAEPICTNGEFQCLGTSYVLCENGQWLPGVLISGQCNYNSETGTGTDVEIIDEPITDTITPRKKPSSIWTLLLIILIIAVVAAIAVIFFIFLKKRQDFNDKTKTIKSSSPPPYSKTPSIQSPKPASILPPPSTPYANPSNTNSSISSASNLSKKQL